MLRASMYRPTTSLTMLSLCLPLFAAYSSLGSGNARGNFISLGLFARLWNFATTAIHRLSQTLSRTAIPKCSMLALDNSNNFYISCLISFRVTAEPRMFCVRLHIRSATVITGSWCGRPINGNAIKLLLVNLKGLVNLLVNPSDHWCMTRTRFFKTHTLQSSESNHIME